MQATALCGADSYEGASPDSSQAAAASEQALSACEMILIWPVLLAGDLPVPDLAGHLHLHCYRPFRPLVECKGSQCMQYLLSKSRASKNRESLH